MFTPRSQCRAAGRPGRAPRVFGRLRSLLLGTACALAATPVVQAEPAPASNTLRVLTLNLAHGRGTSLNQLLVSTDQHRANLVSVAELLGRVGADVVALQEADGPSFWSGGFDHVETLARRAGFDWHFRGDHAESRLFRYGTALLSRLPLQNIFSQSFEPTPPTPRKGFVLGELRWPFAGPLPADSTGDRRPVAIDVVSVHLDYRSETARQGQLDALTRVLTDRARPTIVLGDFNLDWPAADSPLARMAREAGLSGYAPHHPGLATHGAQRIDWVLISRELRFSRYEVLPDRVSDHYAVLADIEMQSPAVAQRSPGAGSFETELQQQAQRVAFVQGGQ